jgi:hypothetical protein
MEIAANTSVKRIGLNWTWIVAKWPYAVISFAIFVLRLPTLSNNILSFDEPAYLVQAARLHSLERFALAFQYRIETKTQIGLIPYLLADLLDHRNAIALLHLFGLLAALITCLFMIRLAERFLRSNLIGLVSALIWSLYLVLGPLPELSVNNARQEFLTTLLEYFQTPFVLASIYFFLESTRKAPDAARSTKSLFGSGVCWAVAMLIKPSVLLLGPLFVLALTAGGAQELPGRSRLKGIVGGAFAFSLGTLIPICLVFSPYLFNAAALAELRFNLIDINSAYAEIQGGSIFERASFLTNGLPSPLLFILLLAPLALFVTRKDQATRRVAYPLLLLLGSCVAAFLSALPGRAFLHYMVVVVPLLALVGCTLVGTTLSWLSGQGKDRLSFALAAAFCTLYFVPQIPALQYYYTTANTDQYLNAERRRFDVDSLISYIKTHSQPGSTIWVYYSTPEVYLLADRYPATRDPDSLWLTLYWNEPWFSRSTEDLVADKPGLIIGINDPIWPRPKASVLERIPKINSLISSEYSCTDNQVRGTTICTREEK